MQRLNTLEVEQVNGGCAEYCWGDFDIGSFGASVIGGAVAGSFAGPVGALGGAAGAATTYILEVMWTDDE